MSCLIIGFFSSYFISIVIDFVLDLPYSSIDNFSIWNCLSSYYNPSGSYMYVIASIAVMRVSQ